MDNERILDIQKDLRKFQELGPFRTKQLLQFLQKANLTKDQIKETKISKTVTSLVNQEIKESETNIDQQKEVVQIAKKIVENWKRLFQAGNKASNPTNNKSDGQLKKSPKKLTFEQVSSNILIKYKSEDEYIQFPYRFTAMERLFKHLRTASGPKVEDKHVNEETLSEMSLKIEKGVWKHNINEELSKQERNYKQDMMQIIKTLKDEPNFKVRIVTGEHTIEELQRMDDTLFLTEAQKKEIEKRKKDEQILMDANFRKKQLQEFNKKAADGEECPYCRSQKAYCEQEVQIRGSDEPMTRFMRCNDCQKDWQD